MSVVAAVLQYHPNTGLVASNYKPHNPLPPNVLYIYICRTAPLTSRRFILNIYSTNIRSEYFKHAA
jgi:hypothetical protein